VKLILGRLIRREVGRPKGGILGPRGAEAAVNRRGGFAPKEPSRSGTLKNIEKQSGLK
jgi:hypothetical protein